MIATHMQLEFFFVGKSQNHPRLMKKRQLKSKKRQHNEAKIVSVPVLSKY